MNIYREINLGIEGIEYIRHCLSDGKTLSKYLLQCLNLTEGRVITFLPKDISDEGAIEFSDGKLEEPPRDTHRIYTAEDGTSRRMVPKPNVDFWLVEVIQTYLSAGENRCCIFENALAESADPWLLKAKSKILTLDSEVYHFLSRGDAEPAKIGQTIKEARSTYPPLVGALASTCKQGKNVRGFSHESQTIQKISTDELRFLAENNEKIIVGAYDGEGYVIWSKS